MKEENREKNNENIKEDFMPQYFEWLTLEEQKKRAKHIEEILKKEKK